MSDDFNINFNSDEAEPLVTFWDEKFKSILNSDRRAHRPSRRQSASAPAARSRGKLNRAADPTAKCTAARAARTHAAYEYKAQEPDLCDATAWKKYAQKRRRSCMRSHIATGPCSSWAIIQKLFKVNFSKCNELSAIRVTGMIYCELGRPSRPRIIYKPLSRAGVLHSGVRVFVDEERWRMPPRRELSRPGVRRRPRRRDRRPQVIEPAMLNDAALSDITLQGGYTRNGQV
ncbi:hypothetical protein EVAR_29215_1 [Eumeta japonica]|uniref:Uncharacterized protein n=1 Tax=Eumeta variegata TaxID=151549 RepID=A0A4C1VIP6_EUMVA|nr:hypothetical protein EVAR_29215_1 [Eumeta japonica]